MVAKLSAAQPANTLEVGRGIAIVSVMYGHALASWFMGAGSNFSDAAFLQWKFGASFMMTFFFFLSGAGWRSTRNLASAFHQGLSLLVTAWLVSVSFDALRVALTATGVMSIIGAPGLDLFSLFRGALRLGLFADSYATGAMWFLAALGIVRIIAALATHAGALATMAIAAILLALMVAAIDHNWRHIFQIHLLGVAFVGFVLGYAARDIWRRAEAAPLICAILCGAGFALTLATFDLNHGCRWDFTSRCGSDLLNGNFGVSMIVGQFGNLRMFALTAAVGCVFAACLTILLARAGAIGRVLASWGRNSMDLLIVNALFVVLLTVPLTRWVAPYVPANNLFFFVGLLTITLAVNLAVRALLARPLRRLRVFSRNVATRMVDGAIAIFEQISVAPRGYRVSREHD